MFYDKIISLVRPIGNNNGFVYFLSPAVFRFEFSHIVNQMHAYNAIICVFYNCERLVLNSRYRARYKSINNGGKLQIKQRRHCRRQPRLLRVRQLR